MHFIFYRCIFRSDLIELVTTIKLSDACLNPWYSPRIQANVENTYKAGQLIVQALRHSAETSPQLTI